MSKLKIGILGTANIAKRSIIPELLKLDKHYELAGIASRDINQAKEVGLQYGVNPFASYLELINPNFIDALYIPLPNALHYKHASLALSKGLHVLVEKSLGCNYNEVKDLVNIARDKNVLLMENFQFRFHSQLHFLTNFLASEKIGEIRTLTAAFCFPPFSDKNNIRYQKELGGGALLDAGAYTVKVSTLLLGRNLNVKASVLRKSSEHNVNIWGSAYLVDEQTGVNSSCIFGFDNYYQCGVQIIGSKGKLSTNRLFTARENFKPVFEIEINGKEKEIFTLPEDNHFKNMLLSFHKYTMDDEAKENENLYNLKQAKLIQDINEKAYEKE